MITPKGNILWPLRLWIDKGNYINKLNANLCQTSAMGGERKTDT